jgi:5-formyltetrahydrofolate cyclo-ligase
VRDPAVLVVVPGIGFDATGRRLGRGLGYYDRALAALRRDQPVTVVGIAYELQIVAELPHEPWDEPVDVIVTERRVLPCRATPSGAFGPARHRGGAR